MWRGGWGKGRALAKKDLVESHPTEATGETFDGLNLGLKKSNLGSGKMMERDGTWVPGLKDAELLWPWPDKSEG